MRTNAAFWDTSAIIPLCIQQDATTSARGVKREFSVSVIWWGSKVEINSSLARLKRNGQLEIRSHKVAIKQLSDFQKPARIIRPSEVLLAIAAELPEKYGLRSLDAFQLAAALVWCNERPRNRPFICADGRLGEAAKEAGFEVVSLS